MNPKIIDYAGDVVGSWTVLQRGPKDARGNALWMCRCACGAEKIIESRALKRGGLRCRTCRPPKVRNAGMLHRHTWEGGRSPTYMSWQNMISRCTQPSSPAFAHYQRRGITVCERWRDFRAFLEDMGERPSPGHTLDRWPANEGNYEPGNVRWATKREQANNRSTNIRFEYRGDTYTLAELARATGVSKELLRGRLCRHSKGWTVEGAVNTPPGVKGCAC